MWRPSINVVLLQWTIYKPFHPAHLFPNTQRTYGRNLRYDICRLPCEQDQRIWPLGGGEEHGYFMPGNLLRRPYFSSVLLSPVSKQRRPCLWHPLYYLLWAGPNSIEEDKKSGRRRKNTGHLDSADSVLCAYTIEFPDWFRRDFLSIQLDQLTSMARQ